VAETKPKTISIRVLETTYDALRDAQDDERRRTKIEPTMAELLDRAWRSHTTKGDILHAEKHLQQNVAKSFSTAEKLGNIQNRGFSEERLALLLHRIDQSDESSREIAMAVIETLLGVLHRTTAAEGQVAEDKPDAVSSGEPGSVQQHREGITRDSDLARRIEQVDSELDRATESSKEKTSGAPKPPHRKKQGA
jgi:hypothetical protein